MNIVQKVFPRKITTKPVGRWNNDYCVTKTNTKIDWSNEDHCGSCGEYVLKDRLYKIPQIVERK